MPSREFIKPGTSGGPIINETGELVGIVSTTIEETYKGEKCVGYHPYPSLALPRWILNELD